MNIAIYFERWIYRIFFLCFHTCLNIKRKGQPMNRLVWFVWDRVSCVPGWPGTHSVMTDDLGLLIFLPHPPAPVLGLQTSPVHLLSVVLRVESRVGKERARLAGEVPGTWLPSSSSRRGPWSEASEVWSSVRRSCFHSSLRLTLF